MMIASRLRLMHFNNIRNNTTTTRLLTTTFHTENDFHDVADDLLDRIEVRLEQDNVIETIESKITKGEFDVMNSQGVLTIDLGNFGTWVINKQTPNQQIWWSSPISGPKRFEFTAKNWVNVRDGIPLITLLNHEMEDTLGVSLRL